MAYVELSRVSSIDGMYLVDYDSSKIFCDEGISKEIAKMPMCDVSLANPFTNVDLSKFFIIAHHNIQSLNAHIDDLKLNKELRKAHIICISETWFTGTEYDQTIPFHIDGYDLVIQESSGRGRGVAMYIQRSVNHDAFHMHLNTCSVLLCDENVVYISSTATMNSSTPIVMRENALKLSVDEIVLIQRCWDTICSFEFILKYNRLHENV